jgi:hypothetical protein
VDAVEVDVVEVDVVVAQADVVSLPDFIPQNRTPDLHIL